MGEYALDTIIEALAFQFDIIDDARRRIKKEGQVVRNIKGGVEPHPSIKVEKDAVKIVMDLLKKS